MSVDTGSSTTTRPTAEPPQALARTDTVRSSQGPESLDVRKLRETLFFGFAPSTLITALAFFFGVERQIGFEERFGIDPSLLGFSVHDYLVRSTDALISALLVLALIGLFLLRLHAVVQRQVQRQDHTGAYEWASLALIATGATSVALGVLSLFGLLPIPFFLFQQAALALGIGMLAYGASLHGRVAAAGRSSPTTETGAERRIHLASLVCVAIVVLVSLFWATADFARAVGRGRADRVIADLDRLPGATVYSERPLNLGGGVTETPLQGRDAAYRFRYDGLRLFLRSGGNYFLLPTAWAPEKGVAIVLHDDPSIRLELTPGHPDDES